MRQSQVALEYAEKCVPWTSLDIGHSNALSKSLSEKHANCGQCLVIFLHD